MDQACKQHGGDGGGEEHVHQVVVRATAALKQLRNVPGDTGLRQLLLELQAATTGALRRGPTSHSDGHGISRNCTGCEQESCSSQATSVQVSETCPVSSCACGHQTLQHQQHSDLESARALPRQAPPLPAVCCPAKPAKHGSNVQPGHAGMDMGMVTLHAIRRYMAQVLGSQASVAKDEELHFPTRGENADCTQSNTLSVDSFLFDADDVDELTEAGELPSHYCQDCGSRNVQELTYISHSMSLHQLRYLFDTLLPEYCPGVSRLLDIGSRLGAVLFAGYCLSPELELTGIEMNRTYVEQQCDVVSRFKLSDRVQVVEGDIRHHLNLIGQADLIILHNVFEFFGNLDFRQELWRLVLGALVGTGAFVVAVPAIEESLAAAELPPSLMSHLEPIPLHSHTHGGTGSEDEGDEDDRHDYNSDDDDDEAKEDIESIFLYKVTTRPSEA